MIVFLSLAEAEYLDRRRRLSIYAPPWRLPALLCLASSPEDVDMLVEAFLALRDLAGGGGRWVQGFQRIIDGSACSSEHYARYAMLTLVLHSLVVARQPAGGFLPCFAQPMW